jgi:hypothetical protein
VQPLFLWKNKKNVTESVCVSVAIVFHHEKRIRRIVICGLSCTTRFFTLSHKRNDFRNTVLEYKMCVLIFSTSLSETFLFLTRIDMIYLLTAIGLSPSGSSTVHIYTQTIHRTIQNKQYMEQHNNFGRMRAVPRLG